MLHCGEAHSTSVHQHDLNHEGPLFLFFMVKYIELVSLAPLPGALDVGYNNVTAKRVTYVGELGFELYVPSESACSVYVTPSVWPSFPPAHRATLPLLYIPLPKIFSRCQVSVLYLYQMSLSLSNVSVKCLSLSLSLSLSVK